MSYIAMVLIAWLPAKDIGQQMESTGKFKSYNRPIFYSGLRQFSHPMIGLLHLHLKRHKGARHSNRFVEQGGL